MTVIRRSSTFGAYYDLGALLRRADGRYPTSVIVATTGGRSGLHPRRVLLPHQLYVRTATELLDTAPAGDREVRAVGIYGNGFEENWPLVTER